VEGNKAPPPKPQREQLDQLNARRSLREQPLQEDKDKLGIEDADPRWSKRELVLKQTEIPAPDPDALLRLSGDATDFRGQPADPFEVLIKRREERRQRARRGTPEIAIRLLTGLEPLDSVLDGLEARLYAVSGPTEPAKALAHQVACEVAREFPVVYAAHGQAARDLTLLALGRLAGNRAPGDLARARAVADAFRPIRENLAIVECDPQETIGRLRARLQGALARRQVRRGLLAVSDLLAVVTGGARSLAAPDRPAWGPKARAPEPAPAGSVAPEVFEGAVELARFAFQQGLPVFAVLPADLGGAETFVWAGDLPEPVRLVLSEPAVPGGPLTLTVHRPQPRQLRPRAGEQRPPELAVVYNPRRGALEPAAPPG